MSIQVNVCKKCGQDIHQTMEKAVGTGEWAMVWASDEGWICESDDNEHEPTTEEETALYLRDLDYESEGMSLEDLMTDDLFNDLVDAMENKGHSRMRVEHDLRNSIAEQAEADREPLDVYEAVNLGIFAINTFMEPDASSGDDCQYLEDNAARAIAGLIRIREWIVAQGEDLPEWLTEPMTKEERS